MFDDEDGPAPAAEDGFPRALERMSVDALEAYAGELEREVARVRGEIARKRRLGAAAAGLFEPPP